jgi:hypothetical protein
MRPEHWVFTIPLRLRSLFRWMQADQELDDELRDHLERKTEQYVAKGMAPEEAQRRARLDLGGIEQTKEQCRDTRRVNWVQDLIQDLHFGLRLLRKSPGFSVVAIVTLALGIGANTAIFSLLDGLVLRDLSVPHPEQLVRFGAQASDDAPTSLSLPMFQEFSRSQRVFTATLGSWGDIIATVEIGGVFSQADLIAVTGNYYSQLGAVAEVGRLIAPEDVNLDSLTPMQVAVLDYGFWQRHCGAARDVIGKTIKIEDVPFTVIGVSREGFKARRRLPKSSFRSRPSPRSTPVPTSCGLEPSGVSSRA